MASHTSLESSLESKPSGLQRLELDRGRYSITVRAALATGTERSVSPCDACYNFSARPAIARLIDSADTRGFRGKTAFGASGPVSVSAARQRLEAGVAKLVLTLGRSYGKNGTPLSESHLTVLCCSLFMHLLQVAAFGLTVLGSAGAFGKSKNQLSGLYTKFQDYGFLQTLESM